MSVGSQTGPHSRLRIGTDLAGRGVPGVESSSSARSSLLPISLAALGLTELCCFFLIAPLLHPRHAAVYHWSGTGFGLFFPVFLDLFLVWACFVALLAFVDAKRLPRIVVWLSVLLLTPAFVSYNFDLLFNGAASALTLRLLVSCVVAGAVLACGWRMWGQALGRVADGMSTLMIFFGISGVLVLLNLAWAGGQARGLNRGPKLHIGETAAPTPPRGRIVWIVFDELSYQQVYERRFRGLTLPAFDELAAEANVLTQTVPAGIFTDIVLPSLLSGRTIDVVRSSASGALSTHDPRSGAWQAFDPRDTVFEDALRNGYGTAVAGWYVPYCRILPAVLDRCFWSYDIPIKNRMSSQKGILGNMLAPFLYAVSGTGWMPQRWLAGFPRMQAFQTYGAEMHIEDYESLSRSAEAALRDQSAGFVLLHFPVPHLGGIYNRATGRFTTGASTYLDNLALADRCLAHLRSVLEETGQWDSSVVVVMGDHSWRTREMVPDLAALESEEWEASQGGKYDPRPVYVVKLAGQRTGVRVDMPFSAVHTRTLLDEVMAGDVRTPQGFAQTVQRLH